jgi:DNA-binding GntR family transcriptional regulator
MPAELIKLAGTPDLVDRVHGALLDAICDGSLAPGQRVTQDELASSLAVSRQPVLQALRLLKSEGLVLDAPGRGVLVAPLDAAWMAQVYEVRGALDALAARLAAVRRQSIDTALVAAGRAAAAGTDVKAMIDADLAFHHAIYAASGNALLGAIAAQHWHHLRRVMGAVLQASQQRSAVWDEHEAIADAIAAGQGERAATLITEHASNASRDLAQRLALVLANPPRRHTAGDIA